MASNFHGVQSVTILSFLIVLVSLPEFINSIPSREYEMMVSVLRTRGYNLFSNAITTSDLHFDLLSSHNSNNNSYSTNNTNFFTFFAPTDSSLFTLDMTQTASIYTDTLRLHVVPRRLSITDLLRLNSSFIPTLLSSRALHVTTRPRYNNADVLIVSLNGVDVVFPRLYNGRYVVVHGLSGIISLQSQLPLPYVSSTPLHRPITQYPHTRTLNITFTPANTTHFPTLLAPLPKLPVASAPPTPSPPPSIATKDSTKLSLM